MSAASLRRSALAGAAFLILCLPAARPARAESLPGPTLGESRRSFDLAPELRWGARWGFIRAGGVFENREENAWTGEPRLAAHGWTALAGGLGAALTLDAGTERWPGVGRTARYQTVGLLGIRSRRASAWIGGGAARVRSDERLGTTGLLQAGVSVNVGAARLILSSRSSNYSQAYTVIDTIFTPGDSLPPMVREFDGQTSHTYTDTGFDVEWNAGRLTFGAGMNLRLGQRLDEPRTSGRLSGRYRVGPRLALTVSGGRQASLPDQGIPSHPFASLGVQLNLQSEPSDPFPLPSLEEDRRLLFSVRPVEGGMYRVRVWLPDAGRVELAGDFSDWSPLVMRNAGGGAWEADCAMSPGSHRVNVRIDGGRWTAPPGLQSVEDEFSGRVGLFWIGS